MCYTRRMFFSDWYAMLRVVVVAVLAYVALLVLLRTSGKRTLSKMNAFDLVVTVALGSTLATAILSPQTPLLEGILGLAMLILLQFVVAWLSVRSQWFGGWIKSQPRMLYYRGQFLRDAMRRERVVESEVLAAVRAEGMGSMEDVDAVVLETAGTFTVLPKSDRPLDAARDVTGNPDDST